MQLIVLSRLADSPRMQKRAKIKDVELCQAIEQVLLGQVDDLGGDVFRKKTR
jgi:hypothetical protein